MLSLAWWAFVNDRWRSNPLLNCWGGSNEIRNYLSGRHAHTLSRDAHLTVGCTRSALAAHVRPRSELNFDWLLLMQRRAPDQSDQRNHHSPAGTAG
jgi:hypothetical protein